jgi:hypothetical protein
MFENFKTQIANRLLYLLFYSSWRNFRRKSKFSKKTQLDYLSNVLKKNESVQFGSGHEFSRIKTVKDFQKLVPVSNYEDYTEYIDLIRKGQPNILTADAVTKFALSSGTATATKLIPNTKSLLQEFNLCLGAWIFNLYRNIPDLLNGKAFWIISPSTKTSETQDEIKKGFENDSEYFSPARQWLIRNVFAVPDEVSQFCEGENYYFVLGTFLVRERNLRLISVWNPTVLLILLDKIILYQDPILKSLETGVLNVPEKMDSKPREILENKLGENSNRARDLRGIFGFGCSKEQIWKAVWPDLSLLSAWDSAWAAIPAMRLKELFPGVIFQGKGLLATEACITFPVFNRNLDFIYLPAITSHFFEFEQQATKEIKLLDELQVNCSYEVIVTTGGGFYRYRLNDIVRCEGFSNGLPILVFEGKSDLVSDVAGEKLHEDHIMKILQNAFGKLHIESPFFFLAPETEHGKTFYILFIQTDSEFSISDLQKEIETGLCENFHYKHCRTLNQLGESAVFLLKADAPEKFYRFIQKSTTQGAFKQTILRKETGWGVKLKQSS